MRMIKKAIGCRTVAIGQGPTVFSVGAVSFFLSHFQITSRLEVGWLFVLGLTAPRESISVYIGPSPREREKERRNDR